MDIHEDRVEMVFETIVIVGVGLMGGSLGLAIRRRNPDVRIVGVSSPAAIKRALELGAITEGCGYDEMDQVVGDADLVVLCTPINRIQGLITQLAPMLKPGVLVTDVGSTKRTITTHAHNTLPAGVHFIGGHPMAGSEKSGINAADPFLFQNAIYVLCPDGAVPETLTRSFVRLLDTLGSVVVVLDAESHDRIAAAVSHLPQLLAITLVDMVGGLDSGETPYLRLAAGGFRDMTRIASSPYGMWDDIFCTNGDAVRDAIDAFIKRLNEVRDTVGDAALGDVFDVANATRETIPKDTKGFMHRLSEVLVVVEDTPGVIARIAGTLAEIGVNIKDIEVMKVREGEGGTLRLAFEDDTAAANAIRRLEDIGFSARKRG
jgi:prephenate dehydrogenase